MNIKQVLMRDELDNSYFALERTYNTGLFRHEVINYYQEFGRMNLPWRQTANPWKILLSEMLLRKTTAKQVENVYQKLSQLNISELGKMKKIELERILYPLGIYRERARLLKDVSQRISSTPDFRYSDERTLLALPGVGQYSANAVLCFAFNEPKPALDRNMIRVMERVFSIKSEKERPHTDKRLWKTAEMMVSIERPKEYNWGILDISAAVCRPNTPLCENCPLMEICDYFEVIR